MGIVTESAEHVAITGVEADIPASVANGYAIHARINMHDTV